MIILFAGNFKCKKENGKKKVALLILLTIGLANMQTYSVAIMLLHPVAMMTLYKYIVVMMILKTYAPKRLYKATLKMKR